MALLEMKNITKSYYMADQLIPILKGITFSIDRGEYCSITGPSGSGKSTLMHLIGCLDTPTSGSYFINGQDVSRMSSDELAKIRNEHLGFVFQKFHLLDDLTALDNVTLPLLYAEQPERIAQQEAKKLLGLVNLAERLNYYPNQLSGGQQQRVAIARALANNPDILLADEPTGNLDTITGKTIINTFEHLNKDHGVTVVLVTHDLELAKKTNRMIVLRDGLIVDDIKSSNPVTV